MKLASVEGNKVVSVTFFGKKEKSIQEGSAITKDSRVRKL